MQSPVRYLHQMVSMRSVRLIGLALLLALAGFLFSRQAFADDTSANNSERLVTIHDGTAELSVVTKAATVKAALEQAGVSIEQRDIVEPALGEKLVAKSYQINVFRARPVVVVDGIQAHRVVSAEQSPKKLADAAGMSLYDEDRTVFERVDDVLSEGGAGTKLVIDRATTFEFTLYGKTFTARSQAATVGAMLQEKGITLGEKDGVSPSIETPLTHGVSVRVWRDGKQTVTQEMVIPKPVEEVKDLDREVGYREVKTPGVEGKRNATFEIETKDGVEVARREIASVTMLEPVKEVVLIGAKPKSYSGSHADWMLAAGISPSDFTYVEALIQKESGWNPLAMNSSSGACGLVQALPCSKLGPNWNDPVVALRWGQGYVTSRYGGWAGAWAHSQSRGWY